MSHIVAGLCHPIDPFITQFLDFCKVVPLELTYNSVVILVSLRPFVARYVSSHQFLCFPVSFASRSIAMGEVRLVGRGVGGYVPRLLKWFSNKKPDWDSKCFMVESIQGWNFPRPVDGFVRLRDLKDAGGDDVSRKDIYDLVV